MDETEFLRGIEGEQQNGTDLVNGAEHLVRLKIQSGLQQKQQETQYPDLEIEKKAGMAGGGGVGSVLGEASQIARPAYDAARQMGTKGNALGTVVRSKSMNSPVMPRFPGHKLAGEFTREDNVPGPVQNGTMYDSEAQARRNMCENCGKAKFACMCGSKTASLQELLAGARAQLEKKAGIEKLRESIRARPMLRNALIAGGASGITGAVGGAAFSPPGHRVHGAIDTGAKSALLGAGGGALVHQLSKLAAATKLKTAYLEKTGGSIAETLKKVHPAMYGTIGLGAIGGGIGTYLASRPRKELEGRSKAEAELESKVTGQNGMPEPGLLNKMKNRDVEHMHGYAKAFRDHPVKAGLLGAIAGGIGGYGLGQMGNAIFQKVRK